MDLGLSGKRALITGASRGIGKSIAEHLLAEGVDIAICARTAKGLEAAVAELSTIGPRVIGRTVDVSDTVALRDWVDWAADELGGIDAFVSNVSAGGGVDKWQETFQTDLMGNVRGAEAVIPHLAAAGGGSIVIINTTSAVEVFRGPTAYAAFKAGLLNYAKNLSREVGPDGIRVNSVLPGPVFFEGGIWETLKVAQPEYVAAVEADIPLGRMAEPADIARAVTFLSSAAARYISGTALVVDGSFTKRIQY